MTLHNTSPYASDHQEILGWHDSMSNEDYHSGPGLSKSSLDLIHKSVNHFLSRSAVRKETPAMRLGTAVHSAILEPDDWPGGYVRGPGVDARTAEWKEVSEQALASGRVLLPPDDYDKVEMMRESVLSIDNKYVDLIKDSSGIAEGSLFGEDPMTGALLKIRPDYIIPEKKLIIDVKSSKNARPAEFARSAGIFRYDVQAALYSDVAATHWDSDADKWEFVFLVVENQPPFNAAVYHLHYGDVEEARREYLADINKYMQFAEGYEVDCGYGGENTCLKIPVYIRRNR